MSSIFCCKDINAITCNISRQCQNFINQFTLLLRKLKLLENIYLIFPNIKSWKIKKSYEEINVNYGKTQLINFLIFSFVKMFAQVFPEIGFCQFVAESRSKDLYICGLYLGRV